MNFHSATNIDHKSFSSLFQTTRRPDIFEISPRPFSFTENGFSQVPFTRGPAALNQNEFYQTETFGQTGASQQQQEEESLLQQPQSSQFGRHTANSNSFEVGEQMGVQQVKSDLSLIVVSEF